MRFALIVVILFQYSLAFTNRECVNRIYRECLVPSYTEQELNIAIDYVQNRFGATNPSLRACSRREFRVRKEIRCLAREEYEDLIQAWKQLYTDGTVDQLTELHYTHWMAEHKYCQGPNSHLEFISRLEKAMRAINPKISMPYWDFQRDFAHPELSAAFELFGHAGNASNHYCLTDGPFAGIQVNFPTKHCIRRQWRPDGTLWPWKSPEWFTSAQQMPLNWPIVINTFYTVFQQMGFNTDTIDTVFDRARNSNVFDERRTPYFQILILTVLVSHFDVHLSIGGYAGDMSVKYAPNDPLFYLFHLWFGKYYTSWQLSNFDDDYILPISYNFGGFYNTSTGQSAFSDIMTERLDMFPEIFVRDTFETGFGDRCYIYDSMIKPINEIHKRVKQGLNPVDPNRPLPLAAQRLKSSLSETDFRTYFPKFAANAWTDFDHTFVDTPDACNRQSQWCARMPRAPHFVDTAEGQRQFQLFDPTVDGLDIRSTVYVGENIYDSFMNALSRYCSPNAVLPSL